MGKDIFAEEILENMFPELSGDEESLYKAMNIAFPDFEIPENAFKNIQNTFNYITGIEKELFLTDHKTREDRLYYKTSNQIIDWLNFEYYLSQIIDVLLFTQKFDPTLREIVREYYDSKGKRFERQQIYLNSKIGELAINLIFDPNKIPESTSSWKEIARMKYPFCRQILQKVFFDALGISEARIKCLNTNDSFEEVIKGYLKYTEPGGLLCLSLYEQEDKVSSRGTKSYIRSKVTSRIPSKRPKK